MFAGFCQVPWCLRGTLVLNAIFTMVHSAAMRPDLKRRERVELSMTTWVLMDMCKALADDRAMKRGAKKGTYWIHPVTATNLKEMCSFVILLCMHWPEECWFSPDKLTELGLEQWFGHLRAQYISSQMSVRDFLHAQAKQMRRFMQSSVAASGESVRHPRENDPMVSKEEMGSL